MSSRALNWVWDNTEIMKPGHKLLMLALAEQADEIGICWPNQERLAELCLCTDRSVRGWIAEIEKTGQLLVCRHKSSDGTNAGNLYLLPIPNTDPAMIRRKIFDAITSMTVHRKNLPPQENISSYYKNITTTDINQLADRMIRQLGIIPIASEKPMKTPKTKGKGPTPSHAISQHWRPNDAILKWCADLDLPNDWIEEEINSFIIYWGERGTKRPGWNATFQNRLKHQIEYQTNNAIASNNNGASNHAKNTANGQPVKSANIFAGIADNC